MVVLRPAARQSGWRRLSPAQRRRIVLGAFVTVSIAARDLVLFLSTAGLFALAELAPAARPLAARSA